MQIIDNYADLVVKIGLIEEQIKLTEWELEYWFGIKADGSGVPMSGKGSQLYGALTSLRQAASKFDAIERLEEQKAFYLTAKERMDVLMSSLDSLDYKIAYRRIVYAQTHVEIAEELGYTEQYIRRKWAKLKHGREAEKA